jgi:hypothetical protein
MGITGRTPSKSEGSSSRDILFVSHPSSVFHPPQDCRSLSRKVEEGWSSSWKNDVGLQVGRSCRRQPCAASSPHFLQGCARAWFGEQPPPPFFLRVTIYSIADQTGQVIATSPRHLPWIGTNRWPNATQERSQRKVSHMGRDGTRTIGTKQSIAGLCVVLIRISDRNIPARSNREQSSSFAP